MQILREIIEKVYNSTKSHFEVQLINEFEKEIQNCETILDLGCGKRSLLELIKKKKYSVGVDIFRENIEISKKKQIHDEYMLLNIMEIDQKFSEKAFDCIILIDVIEHLDKLDGLQLIRKMEMIAKRKIIIFTPNGYVHQEKYENNPHQVHNSSWNVKDFKKLNFKVYGINGLKFIRGDLSRIRLKPEALWRKISIFSEFFVKIFPQFGYQLFCIKDL